MKYGKMKFARMASKLLLPTNTKTRSCRNSGEKKKKGKKRVSEKYFRAMAAPQRGRAGRINWAPSHPTYRRDCLFRQGNYLLF
jgi:hypothetical protein